MKSVLLAISGCIGIDGLTTIFLRFVGGKYS